jgi:ABC-type branched-subunit amino acid transport system permease subunit
MTEIEDIKTKRRTKIFYGLAILILFFLPFFIPYKALGSQILIFMLFAMGYDICLGYAGMLSFGHAAFFGMGAYTTGLLILHHNANILLAIFAGILLSVFWPFPSGTPPFDEKASILPWSPLPMRRCSISSPLSGPV